MSSNIPVTASPVDCTTRLPVDWLRSADKGNSVHDVASDNEFYRKLDQYISQSGLQLEKLQRIQNQSIWKDYAHRTTSWRVENPDDSDHECYLFHGSASNPNDLIQEGLDSRLSRKGRLGKGLYFSDEIEKPLKYSKKMDNGQSLIYMCRVQLGFIKEYPDFEHHRELVREPNRGTDSTGKKLYYDSVMGRPKDYREFVVYKSDKVLLEYMLTVSKVASMNSVLSSYETTAQLSSDDENEQQDGPLLYPKVKLKVSRAEYSSTESLNRSESFTESLNESESFTESLNESESFTESLNESESFTESLNKSESTESLNE